MNKLTINDLLHLGVRFSFAQKEAFEAEARGEPPEGYMVPWQLPDPMVLAIGERDTSFVLPDKHGTQRRIWWPRVLHTILPQFKDEVIELINDDWIEGWDRLPQVIGVEGHALCQLYGGCADEPPNFIGVWAAMPLTGQQCFELEHFMQVTMFDGYWAAMYEFFAFGDRYGTVDELMEQATMPLPRSASIEEKKTIERMADQAEYALSELTGIKQHLGIDDDVDELDLHAEDFEMELTPPLLSMWNELKVRRDQTRDHLVRLFPDQERYIDGSSQW